MTKADAAAMRSDPSNFVIRAALARQQRLEELEQGPPVVPVVFPETVSLNGLRIACQPKGS